MSNYIIGAIIIIALAALIGVAVYKFAKATPEKRRQLIGQLLYTLAVEAERLYGSKTGQVKKMQVIAWFYARYKWLSWFVTEKTLGDWIDETVASMNEWMKSNPVGAANLLGN